MKESNGNSKQPHSGSHDGVKTLSRFRSQDYMEACIHSDSMNNAKDNLDWLSKATVDRIPAYVTDPSTAENIKEQINWLGQML